MPEETFIVTYICEKIKKLRIEQFRSQQEIADRLHMNQNTYSDLESGKRKVDIVRLVILAEIFQVPVSYFFENLPSAKTKRKLRKKK